MVMVVGMIGVGVFCLLAVGASRAAGLGTCAQRLVHDLLDGSGTAAAFGAAAQAAIHLSRGAREILRLGHDVTHIVVSQDVAGTNNHGARRTCKDC